MQLTQDKFDQGRRALERFTKMIAVRYKPLLRAVTGNEKLDVKPHSSQAVTDGSTVWLPVPLALGDETLEHDKSLCGLRDLADMEMLCPMCKVEDGIDAMVFHESAHITEKSFEKLNGRTFLKIVQPVVEPYLDALPALERMKIEDEIKRETAPMVASAKLDPWLPFALNIIEDIYVNRRLFKYREGVEVPMKITSHKTFVHGIEDLNSESNHLWKDNDPTAQALISAYLTGQGLEELGSYLNPDHDLTSDPEVMAIVGKIPSECRIQDRVELAMKLMMHLRSLGYCPTKSTSPLPPPPPPPPPEGESEEPQPQPPEGESEPQPGEGESGDQPEGSKSEDDEAESNHGEESNDEADPEGNPDGETEESDEDSKDEPEAGEGSGQSEESDEDSEDETEAGEAGSSDDESYDGESGIEPEDEDEMTEKGGGKSTESDEQSDDESESSESEGDGDEGEEPTESEAETGSEATEESSWTPPTDEEVDEALERARKMLEEIMGHDASGPGSTNSKQDEDVIKQVMDQDGFDHPSQSLRGGVDLQTKDDWPYNDPTAYAPEIKVPKHMLTPPLTKLRVVFSSNKKTGIERSLKAGSRLDTMHLYRAGTDDPRFFGKRTIPKSRDWFVLIGLDFSGSTDANGADAAHKMAGHAIGELLYLLDIKFEMYAHTSGTKYDSDGDLQLCLEHVLIKGVDDNWRDKAVQRTLFAQRGRGCNLDGHTLEQYRKRIEAVRATDKLLMYFTDGAMPAMNKEEELPILKENIELLRKSRTTLVGVGYRTDSPKQHGLDTIEINSPEDIASIVAGLEARLLR